MTTPALPARPSLPSLPSLPSILAASLLALSASATTGCRPTGHAVEPSQLGQARPSSAMEAVMDQPGPVTVETVIGADWAIERSGLINLDNPKAKAAGLKDGDEAIVVEFHALKHPTQGLYLVDTGVEKALRDDPGSSALSGLVRSAMHIDKMVFRVDTKSWIDAQPEKVAGVFLTHLHLDHVSGMRDVPEGTPVYAGPGETSERAFLHLFVYGSTDRALEGKGAIREWGFSPDPAGAFEGVVDVFGDGTVWALSVPGHTPGSTAYLARTPRGPVLMTGDACHTAWGWQNGVEPGTFSGDKPKSAESLARLKKLEERHPGLDVRLGHQSLPPRAASAGN